MRRGALCPVMQCNANTALQHYTALYARHQCTGGQVTTAAALTSQVTQNEAEHSPLIPDSLHFLVSRPPGRLVIISRGQQVNNGGKVTMEERGVTENFLVLNPHIKTNLHHFFSLLLK